MKPLISLLLAVGITPLGSLSAAESDEEDFVDVVPLMVIDEVPLSDSIANLARQLNLNIIFDPRVPGSGFKPGRSLPNPQVSIRCTNCAISAALNLILARHKLKLTTNVASRVARVVPATDPPPTAPVGIANTDTNKLLPSINLDGIPLREAMEKLADQAQLSLTFDSTFSSFALAHRDSLIHVRWQNISAEQALIALCDNYGFHMVEDSAGSTAKVSLAAPGNAGNGKSRP